MSKNKSVTKNPKFVATQSSRFKLISKQGLQCSMTLAMVCCTINNNNNNNNNNRKVDSLVQTVTIFSNDVGMDLGINKIMTCACKVHFQKIQKIITYYTWRSLSLPRANVTYLSRKQGGEGGGGRADQYGGLYYSGGT